MSFVDFVQFDWSIELIGLRTKKRLPMIPMIKSCSCFWRVVTRVVFTRYRREVRTEFSIIMAVIRLHVKKQHLESEKESIIHSIPCKIHGDETANVSTYFQPYIRPNDNDHLEISFRGHPLKGRIFKVPEGYRGLTFFEYKKPHAKDTVRNLHSTGIFSKFTYWNYDTVPSKNDALVAALDWIGIAEALHSPINDDQNS